MNLILSLRLFNLRLSDLLPKINSLSHHCKIRKMLFHLFRSFVFNNVISFTHFIHFWRKGKICHNGNRHFFQPNRQIECMYKPLILLEVEIHISNHFFKKNSSFNHLSMYNRLMLFAAIGISYLCKSSVCELLISDKFIRFEWDLDYYYYYDPFYN